MIQPCSTQHFSMAKAAFLQSQAPHFPHLSTGSGHAPCCPGAAGGIPHPGPGFVHVFGDFLKHQTDRFFGFNSIKLYKEIPVLRNPLIPVFEFIVCVIYSIKPAITA